MNAPAQASGSRLALWLPLLVFAGFAALVAVGLYRPANHDVTSKMIGQPLPAFDLPAATTAHSGLASTNFAGGKPRLLNVFASWCVPCAAEARELDAIHRAGFEVDGIAIRDTREDLARFLVQNGDPFTRIGADEVSAIQFAIGSSGVPESFVIDAKGVIRYQHIGVIMPDQVPMIVQKLGEASQ